MGQKLLNAKLERAAGRLQPALRILGQLKAKLDPLATEDVAAGGWLSQCAALVEELEAELYSVEAAVGVVTQATLFDCATSIQPPDEPEPSASITFLVDCDYCGQECEAAGNRHTCEHCGKTFDIVD